MSLKSKSFLNAVDTSYVHHRFVDVAATHYNHISVGLTQLGCVYMWGQCRGQSVTLPMETRFQSMHDVFACFGTPPVTWKPLDVGEFLYAAHVTKLELISICRVKIDDCWDRFYLHQDNKCQMPEIHLHMFLCAFIQCHVIAVNVY